MPLRAIATTVILWLTHGSLSTEDQMALTKREIDSFTHDGRSMDFRSDGIGGVPNFGVRVFPSGAKSFVLGYRLPHSRNQRWLTVGKVGVFSIQQARKEAARILAEIGHGIDPKAPAKAEGITLEGFAPIFMGDMRTRGMRTTGEMERRINKHLVPSLGKKYLADIKRADIARLHSAIGKKAKVEANRVAQLIKTMLSRAEMLGYTEEGTPNPCRGLKLYKETSRARYLDDRELFRLREALAEEPVHIQALIRLLLFSGLRKSELLSLPWDAVKINHPEGDHIDVTQTKNGRPLRLALTGEMRETLMSIPTRVHSKWVFPSPVRTNHHINDFKRDWKRIRERAELGDVTVHDLRRTCGSLMAQGGVPIEAISQVLNHSNSDVTRIYARMSEDTQRSALEVASNKVAAVLGELSLTGTDNG
jgi:integrase